MTKNQFRKLPADLNSLVATAGINYDYLVNPAQRLQASPNIGLFILGNNDRRNRCHILPPTPAARPGRQRRPPSVCGAMYPCSNPELVAAVSEAGGIGIMQPISLTYVHGYDFREGIRAIRKLTDKPIGMNALIEQSSKRYHQRMQQWVDIALEEGIRFFVTSLGKPGWVVERVHAAGGLVYHDTTNRKFALKGLDDGVDGLICVNNRAGGHTGQKSAAELYEELADLNVPLICAGGISTKEDYQHAMQLGYEGVQMGTAFIATTECSASDAYKQAIIDSQ